MRCDNCRKRLTKKDYVAGNCLGCGKAEAQIQSYKRQYGGV
jgi:hypothetical protein